MGTTLSTLTNLAIYIALVIVGAFLGSRKALRSRPLVWVGKLQFVALMILIVTLGVNLGANDEVVSSLGQIGLSALVITVLAMAGSILALTLLRRFVLKLDRYGLPQGSEAAVEEETHHAGKADNSLTKWIVIAVVLGMLAGRFVFPPAVTAHCGTVINFGLYLLLFMVGMDMGKQGTFVSDIKTAGFQVLLVPVAVCLGSLIFAAAAGVEEGDTITRVGDTSVETWDELAEVAQMVADIKVGISETPLLAGFHIEIVGAEGVEKHLVVVAEQEVKCPAVLLGAQLQNGRWLLSFPAGKRLCVSFSISSGSMHAPERIPYSSSPSQQERSSSACFSAMFLNAPAVSAIIDSSGRMTGHSAMFRSVFR